MAKPPPDQHCMFCDPNPCACRAPKAKKAASPKKRSKPSADNPSVQTVQTTKPVAPAGPVQSFDPRAAMKAAIQSAPQARPDSGAAAEVPEEYVGSDLASRRIQHQLFIKQGDTRSDSGSGSDVTLDRISLDELDPDARRAIFNLAPLLSERDIQSASSIITDPILRAERWKERRRG